MSKKIVSNARRLKDGEIYEYSREDGFLLKDPGDIVYKNHTVKNLFSYYEAYQDYKKRVSENNELLWEWADKHIIGLEKSELHNTILQILRLLPTVKTKDKLHAFELDEDGYIKDFQTLEGYYIRGDLKVPEDVNNGAHYLDEDGNILEDEDKLEEEWRVK